MSPHWHSIHSQAAHAKLVSILDSLFSDCPQKDNLHSEFAILNSPFSDLQMKADSILDSLLSDLRMKIISILNSPFSGYAYEVSLHSQFAILRPMHEDSLYSQFAILRLRM